MFDVSKHSWLAATTALKAARLGPFLARACQLTGTVLRAYFTDVEALRPLRHRVLLVLAESSLPQVRHCRLALRGMRETRSPEAHHLHYDTLGFEEIGDIKAVDRYCHELLPRPVIPPSRLRVY